ITLSCFFPVSGLVAQATSNNPADANKMVLIFIFIFISKIIGFLMISKYREIKTCQFFKTDRFGSVVYIVTIYCKWQQLAGFRLLVLIVYRVRGNFLPD